MVHSIQEIYIQRYTYCKQKWKQFSSEQKPKVYFGNNFGFCATYVEQIHKCSRDLFTNWDQKVSFGNNFQMFTRFVYVTFCKLFTKWNILKRMFSMKNILQESLHL